MSRAAPLAAAWGDRIHANARVSFALMFAVDERGQDESELKVVDLEGNKQRYRVGEVLQPLPDPKHS